MTYQDLRTPQWFSRRTGWLGFLPTKVNFRRFPLDRLRSGRIERYGEDYRLVREQAQYWDNLDTWLSRMARPFVSRQWNQPARQVLVPPKPSISGYLGTHRTLGALHTACASAQSFFVLWLGYFAFQLSMGDKAGYSDPIAQWWRAECVGVPEIILDAVMSQAAWDGSIPRVGLIHQIFDFQDEPTIFWYIDQSIPVWYPWGPFQEHLCSIKPWGNKYRPPKHILDAAANSTPGILPPPLPSSNSCRREMPEYWLTFKARRDERWAQKVETPLEKQARESREKQPPTSGKVKVYHWVENDDGQRVRTLLTHREKGDAFDIYRYQIFYDSRYNEWDCSTDFGDCNDDFDDPDPEDFVPAVLKTSDSITYAASPPNVMDADPMPSDQVEGASSKMLSPPSDLLQYRFGFLPTFVQALYPAGVCRITDKDWNTLLISLGYKKNSYDQPPFAGAMLDFLNKIHIEKGKENTGPPFVLHDLAGRSPAPLTLTSDFSRLCLPLATYFWKASGTRVESGVISNTMWYRVTALGSGGLGWTIFVRTATDALHLARLPASPGVLNLLEYCIDNGIPCSTRMPLPQQIFPVAPPHLRSPDYTQHVPYRSSDYVFTVADFLAYENHCRHLVIQSSGRAVLLKGGIVNRIASQHLDKNVALDGPSAAVVKYGIGSCFIAEGIHYWDDDLDGEQIDIICGMYVCETGEFWLLVYQLSYSNVFEGQGKSRSAQKQIAYKSWWPTHATWNSASNGRHTGYWSEANEDWFTQRRQSILDGKEQPLSSSKWRDLLKGIKTSRHLKVYTEQTSYKFITDSSRT